MRWNIGVPPNLTTAPTRPKYVFSDAVNLVVGTPLMVVPDDGNIWRIFEISLSVSSNCHITVFYGSGAPPTSFGDIYHFAATLGGEGRMTYGPYGINSGPFSGAVGRGIAIGTTSNTQLLYNLVVAKDPS